MLDTGDASPLMTSLPGTRSREVALVAIANYSKFLGCYDKFQQLKKRYNLKWNQSDSMKSFESFLNPNTNLDSMLSRIREMTEKLPVPMPQIIKFGCLVGLRSSEIIESVRYINDREAFPKYYDANTMTLNHWKMPGMLRTTKKAFISFVTPDMLNIVQNLGKEGVVVVPSLNAIILACKRRHILCYTRYCRKIHATYLHEKGIPVEIIDALQGRTPTSIFAKHYYRPGLLSYKDRVLAAVSELQREINKQ